MATKRWILILLSAAMLTVLAGCNSGSTFNVQNPTLPPSNLCISFAANCPAAPAAYSLLINGTLSLTATVTNDPSNAGVDWSVTCANAGNCGTVSTAHTASGAAVTYTPPASLAGNSELVNVVAYATTNHATNVVAPITVTAFGSNLKGSYVLQAQGVDSNGGPNYQFAGVIVLDGNGGISSGEQTINFFDLNLNGGTFVSKSDTITGGSYFLGPDGRGTITINTKDNDVDPPFSGMETFTFVFLSGSQALIAQADFPNVSAVGVSASGTMDLQTSVAAPLGGYAFVVSGSDFVSGSASAIGGILNIDSPNNISGKGSVTDQNLAGTLTRNQELSGTLSNPDSFGAVTLNLTVPGFPSTTAFQFTGYIVDSTHMKLIESDNPSGAGGIGSTAGVAIAQGSATGTFNNASFSGTYVFGVLGQDLSSTLPSTLTSVGLFAADGAGKLTGGFTDTLLQTAPAQISAAFSGTYTATRTGRAQSFFSHFVPHPTGGFDPTFFFYLTGNTNTPALVLASALNNEATGLLVGAGIAYPQSIASLTFSGDYGFRFTEQNGTQEFDGTAQMAANPTTTPPSLSGSADVGIPGGVELDQPFTGTFSLPCLEGTFNGCFAGTLEGNAFISPNQPFSVDYYIIDSGHGFFVETDLLNPSNPSGVVSLGYYAQRTPACASCQ